MWSYKYTNGKKHGNLAVKQKKMKSKPSEAFSNPKGSDDNQRTLENTHSEQFF